MHKYTAKNKYILKQEREELIKLRSIHAHTINKWQII